LDLEVLLYRQLPLHQLQVHHFHSVVEVHRRQHQWLSAQHLHPWQHRLYNLEPPLHLLVDLDLDNLPQHPCKHQHSDLAAKLIPLCLLKPELLLHRLVDVDMANLSPLHRLVVPEGLTLDQAEAIKGEEEDEPFVL